MNCKVCNTRIRPGDRACPNCGIDAPSKAAFERSRTPSKLPSADLSQARDPDDSEEDVELELDEVTGEVDPAPAPKPKAKPKTKAAKAAAKPAKQAASGSGAAPLFAPDRAGLRTLLAERPDALEAGLGVFRNDDGSAVGAEYSTGVGDIDLLATDDDGNLVVVLISEKGQGDELVGEVLQRLGWVRKHLGDGEQKVRGIVLCEDMPDSLSYAASAVADTVSFKTYRVALTFEDVEV